LKDFFNPAHIGFQTIESPKDSPKGRFCGGDEETGRSAPGERINDRGKWLAEFELD
jgi:hypothetical protein